MTDLEGVLEPGKFGRRGFLGLGAATAGGVALAAGGALLDNVPAAFAQAQAGTNSSGTAGEGDVSAAAVLSPTPGLAYAGASGYEFQTINDPSIAPLDVAGVGLSPSPSSGFMCAGITVPNKAVLKELHFWGTGSTTMNLQKNLFGQYSWSFVSSVATPAGAGLQHNVTALNTPYDATTGTLLLTGQFSTSQAVDSVAIGYVPAAVGFTPVTPFRAYDSRLSGGPLVGGSRTISVKDAHDPGSGAITGTDLVPVGALAVGFNLTITNTVGSGYLWVAPGGTPSILGSTINWFAAGQTFANGSDVGIDSSRNVKVFLGGPGSTDFIIDVVGYYAP